MTDLNAIKSRLGSISPTAMSKLPKAVQTLLKEDLPRLVHLAEATKGVHGKYDPRPESFPDEMARNWPIMLGYLGRLYPDGSCFAKEALKELTDE